MEKDTPALAPRVAKTCDQCKARKVRCIVQPGQTSCRNCIRRKEHCHFSHTKRLLRHPEPDEPAFEPAFEPAYRYRDSVTAHRPNYGSQPTNAPVASRDGPRQPGMVQSRMMQSASPPCEDVPEPELYVDRLLEYPGAGGLKVHDDCMFKRSEDYITSSNLAIFSESRIRLLSQKLGHNKVRDLVERVSAALDAKGNSQGDILDNPPPDIVREACKLAAGRRPPFDRNIAKTYIKAYFDYVHPQFPFLDRKSFEQKAADSGMSEYLVGNRPFSALYHVVLALGCQYVHDKTFDPVSVESWKFASVSLGLLPHVLLPRETMVNLQAITAMAIYALNVACITIGETLCLEAARMVQALGYHRLMERRDPAVLKGSEQECYRMFWVVYMIERQVCFLTGRSPTLADYDIGCPIPPTPECHIEGFNWFVTMLRLSRLCSKSYELLFSTSSTLNSPHQYRTAIARVRKDLHKWKVLVPPKFRPDCKPYPKTASFVGVLMLLKLHYMYYVLDMALCRLELHVASKTGSEEGSAESTKELMGAARTVIQLTKDIDMRPYTSTWVRGTVPLAAMFILFDLVVHNPSHPETELNLSLLDMAAGYFGRFDYATSGGIPASLMSGFAHIANQFVRESREKGGSSPGSRMMVPSARGLVSPDSLSPDDETAMQRLGNGNAASRDGTMLQQAERAAFDAPLSYPTVMNGTEAVMDDELLADFDFTNMFGYVMTGPITTEGMKDYLLF